MAIVAAGGRGPTTPGTNQPLRSAQLAQEPLASGERPQSSSAAPADGYTNVVRAALFMSAHGMSKQLLPGLLHLIAAAKGDIGQ